MEKDTSSKLLDRREFLKRAGIAAAGLGLTACAPAAVPTPTPTTVPAAAAPPTPTQPPPKAATAQPTAMPKPATVRYGTASPVSDAGVFIALERGYFKEMALAFEILTFSGGPSTVAPLSAGQLEVASSSISSGFFNAIDRGVALKNVASKGAMSKGFDSSRVMVRKDLIDSGQVKEVKDLKGKRFAVSGLQGIAESIANHLLEQAGLSIKDVDLVNMAYPDMMVAYANKAIDVAMQNEPQISTAVQNGLAVRWPPGSVSAIYGGEYQAAELVFSEQFAKNTDVARRFMVAYVKGLRDYNDAFAKGKGKSEIISILTKYTAEKDPAVYEKMEMPYLNPDGKMHLPSMKMDFDYFKAMGYYTGKLELESTIDTQFIEYAVQQLGPYK